MKPRIFAQWGWWWGDRFSTLPGWGWILMTVGISCRLSYHRSWQDALAALQNYYEEMNELQGISRTADDRG